MFGVYVINAQSIQYKEHSLFYLLNRTLTYSTYSSKKFIIDKMYSIILNPKNVWLKSLFLFFPQKIKWNVELTSSTVNNGEIKSIRLITGWLNLVKYLLVCC